MKKQNGFTLIELLVVIAIIGILASIVLVSLNSAQKQADDSAIMSELAAVRAQAQLYFNQTRSFAGLCDPDNSDVEEIHRILKSASSYDSPVVPFPRNWDVNCVGGGNATFYSDGDLVYEPSSSRDGWMVIGILNSGDFFCVDYTGFSGRFDDQPGGSYSSGEPLTCNE